MHSPHIDALVRRARRAPRRRSTALLGALLLSLATLLGTTIAVGRAPVPAASIDPAMLTRVVPEPVATPELATDTRPAPTVELEPVPDFVNDRSFPPRPAPALDQAVGVVVIPTPTPRPRPVTTSSGGGGGSRVSGQSSWYCLAGQSACTSGYSGGYYAAAGPALRVGSWRGRTVSVCSGGRCVNVKLIDWCGCPNGRVIDLYSDAFRQLGSLSEGTISVTVSW